MQRYTFKNILHEALKHKKYIIIAHIIAIFSVIISLPIPMMIPLLIDEILLDKPGYMLEIMHSIFNEQKSSYFYIFIILVSVIFLRAVGLALTVLQKWYFTNISKDIIFNIQKSLLHHISKSELSEYENFGGGKIASLLIVDVGTLDGFIGGSISNFIISSLTIIGISATLLYLNWQLGLFIIIFLPIIAFIGNKIGRRVGKLRKIENKNVALFQESLAENTDLYWQIKASNQEDIFINRLISQAEEIKKSAINFSYQSQAANLFSYFLFLMAFEIFRASGILLVEYSDLTIGVMLAIFGYLWVIMAPINSVINIQYSYFSAKAALERINEIFDMKLEPKFEHKKNPFRNTNTNKVEIKNLSFEYEKGKSSLKNINMKFKKGSKVAVVGETGSGKTTLAQLLVGFYQPQQGEILYDDINYDQIGLDVIRENVFLVLQSPMLFNNSIRFNLTLGKEVDDDLLAKAIQVSQLQSLIDSLDKKVDTVIGKNGVKLSGGQRQRLSIARMVIANPNVVILDESTSSLDVNTEHTLFEELSSFLRDRTTIIIAHRLSTIEKADYIYVLDNGEIIEEGEHQSLLAQNGQFADFFNRSKG
jgi:ATP-binding cassette subfamily C protein